MGGAIALEGCELIVGKDGAGDTVGAAGSGDCSVLGACDTVGVAASAGFGVFSDSGLG